MNKDIVNQGIEIFFLNPKIEIKPPSKYGVLYLLRRDIYRCLGYNTETWTIYRESIIWPGIMTLLAGIDLLGKFYKGNDSSNNVGGRFKDYYKTYIDHKNADIIYQLRNSMLHSFGLISKTKNKTLTFSVLSQRGEIVEQWSDTHYTIKLYTLWDKFEDSIVKFKSDIENQELLKINFEKMYKIYGTVIIG